MVPFSEYGTPPFKINLPPLSSTSPFHKFHNPPAPLHCLHLPSSFSPPPNPLLFPFTSPPSPSPVPKVPNPARSTPLPTFPFQFFPPCQSTPLPIHLPFPTTPLLP